jgi:hypothetical protein
MLARDYYLFPAMKQNLEGRRFQDDCDVEMVVTRWLMTQNTESPKI